MLKIGDFSRLAQVTIKTLHHYDDIGLLHPAATDETSGYRYYRLEQLPLIHQIVVLRELGLSLGQIAEVLDEEPTSEALRGMLTLKRAEVKGRLEEEMARLARVEFHLGQIDLAPDMAHLDVRVKEVAPIPRALTLRRTFPSFADFYRVAKELDEMLVEHQDHVLEPLITISHAEEFRETGVDFEFVAPVAESYQGGDLALPIAGTMALRGIEGIEMAATYLFEGRPGEIQVGAVELQRWVAANDYGLGNSVRAVHLRGPRQGLEYDAWLTEFQHPLVKA